MEYSAYLEELKRIDARGEDLCKRCGACCGAYDGDPCEHLSKDAEGGFVCNIYDRRFGHHQTASGTRLICVPIRDHMTRGNLPSSCAYTL